MTDLSIVIVNWNSKEFLRGCLSSVYRLTKDIDYEVIVIDSGSYDGASELVGREFPQAMFIQSKDNLGFARANNVAYEKARGKAVLFLNPDTELVNHAVEMAYNFLDSCADAGAVGCRLLNGDDTVQTSCIQAFPTLLNQALNADALRALFPKSRLWGMAALHNESATPSSVEVISGAFLMLKREAFEKVNRFSEEYFMYAEDVDLCYRLRRAGYVNYFLSQARVRHFGGGSTATAPSDFSLLMMRESIRRFLELNHGRAYARAYRFTTAVAALARLSFLFAPWAIATLRGNATGRRAQAMKKWFTIFQWGIGVKTAAIPV